MFTHFVRGETNPKLVALTFKSGMEGSGHICLITNTAEDYVPSAIDTALQLLDGGWRVTMLDLARPVRDLAAKMEAVQDFTYVQLPGLYKESHWYTPLQSLCVYHWLRQQSFDLLLFQHNFASAFYILNARRMGLVLAKTPIAVLVCAPTAYRLEESALFPSGYTDLECDFLERETIAGADALICLNQEVFTWMQRTTWQMPFLTGYLVENGQISLGPWLDALKSKVSPVATAEPIFISVCMAVYNRPHLLREAIDSLIAQTYQHFEIVIVDDGSTNSEMEALRQELTPLFSRRQWQWIKQENAGPSVARNHAVKIARGSNLLFMDDDNYAYPDELERFAAASARGYDILSCIIGLHPDSVKTEAPTAYLPERSSKEKSRPVGWTPLGNALLLSIFFNKLGETNSLIRREVFEKLGGFQGNREMVFEDFEFLTRAVIAGYKIDVLPEVLMLYRRQDTSRSMGHTIFNSHVDSLWPIAQLLPPALRALLLVIRNSWYERHCNRRDDKPLNQ